MTTRKLRTLFFTALPILLLAVLAGTWFYKQASQDTRQEKGAQDLVETSLRLKWLWYAGWAGELLAMEEGIWETFGLSVSIEPGGFELDPIKLVASGTDDIGVAGADQILLAREKGIPLVAFATQYQVSPVGFVSKESSQINEIADFKGKKIGVKFGTDVEPVYRALLAQAGLESTDLEEVPVKFDLTPFFADAIDVYPGYLTNDLLIPEERGFKVNTIRAIDHGMNYYGNVYFCTEQFLGENPNIVRQFRKAIEEAWEKALAIPPAQIAALAVEINGGLSLEHETRVVESLRSFVIPDGTEFGAMSEDGWQRLYEMLRKQEVIKSDFDFTEAYTLQLLDAE